MSDMFELKVGTIFDILVTNANNCDTQINNENSRMANKNDNIMSFF